MDPFQNLKQILADVEQDWLKAQGGNKAACTRVRKAMQDLKNGAQDVRVKALEYRDTDAS